MRTFALTLATAAVAGWTLPAAATQLDKQTFQMAQAQEKAEPGQQGTSSRSTTGHSSTQSNPAA